MRKSTAMIDFCNYIYPVKHIGEPNLVSGAKSCNGETIDCSEACLFILCVGEGGITLALAPISIRKQWLEVVSFKINRQLIGWPGWLVAVSDWPDRF